MSVRGAASGQREKQSMHVKTYEQPEITDHCSTMSIWACRNYFFGGEKIPRGVRTWRWTLERSHRMQAKAQLVIIRCILGQKKRVVIGFTEAVTPGCDSECKVSNTERRCWLGTRGLESLVVVSHRIVPSETECVAMPTIASAQKLSAILASSSWWICLSWLAANWKFSISRSTRTKSRSPFITWGQIILPFIQNRSWGCRVLVVSCYIKWNKMNNEGIDENIDSFQRGRFNGSLRWSFPLCCE